MDALIHPLARVLAEERREHTYHIHLKCGGHANFFRTSAIHQVSCERILSTRGTSEEHHNYSIAVSQHPHPTRVHKWSTHTRTITRNDNDTSNKRRPMSVFPGNTQPQRQLLPRTKQTNKQMLFLQTVHGYFLSLHRPANSSLCDRPNEKTKRPSAARQRST